MTTKTDIKTRQANQKHKETTKKYNSLMDEYVALKKQMDALIRLKKSDTHRVIPPLKSNGKSPAVAVAVASDWHVEECVDPKKVNHLNKYTLAIAQQRADYFFQKVARLIKKEQQDANINLLVLALLGDFISSNIHDELMENCSLRPMEAILVAQEMLGAGIQYLLDNTDVNLYIPCCPGNHSRITKKIHASTEQGNSLETLLYHSLRSRFSKEPRVEFEIGDGYHIYHEFLGYMLRFHHGTNIQYWGGVGGPTISINKAIHQWNLTKRADCDVFGHLHTAMAMSRFVANGSLIGYSPFAIRIKAEFQLPTQMFFLITQKYGKSVTIPIVCNP